MLSNESATPGLFNHTCIQVMQVWTGIWKYSLMDSFIISVNYFCDESEHYVIPERKP